MQCFFLLATLCEYCWHKFQGLNLNLNLNLKLQTLLLPLSIFKQNRILTRKQTSDDRTFIPVCLSVVWPPSIWPLGWFYYPNAYGNADKVGPSCLTRRLNNFNNAKWDIPTCEGYARSHSIPGSRGPRKYFRIVHECKYIFGAVSHLARSIRFLRESQQREMKAKYQKENGEVENCCRWSGKCSAFSLPSLK